MCHFEIRQTLEQSQKSIDGYGKARRHGYVLGVEKRKSEHHGRQRYHQQRNKSQFPVGKQATDKSCEKYQQKTEQGAQYVPERELLGRGQTKVFQCYGWHNLVARAVVFQMGVGMQFGHFGVVGKGGVAIGVVFQRVFAVETVETLVAGDARARGRNQHAQQYNGGKAPEKDFP